MIVLTPEEAQTVVRSYAFLMELSLEHGFPLRSEELRLYDKMNGQLEIDEMRNEAGLEPQGVGAGPFEHVRNLPTPPANPHAEEDAYAPNIVE